MFRPVLFATALSLAVLPALAQDYDPLEGLYSGYGEGELTVELTHIEDDRYAISIGTLVPMENDRPGCAGGVDGEVLLTKKGGNFFVENEFYDPNSSLPANQRHCEISLRFDGEGNLVLDEVGGCISFHGAACGFSGTLTHDAAGI